MLYNKQKRLIKCLFVSLVLLLSLGIVNTVHVGQAKAANKCDPTTAPCCQPPQVGVGNGDNGPCFDSNHKRYYAVIDNADGSPDPETGHCYTTRGTAFGLAYFNASCRQPPFNVNSQTSGDLNAICTDSNITKDNCGIIRYLVNFIDALSALVGIVIVIVIVVAGMQYSAARDNPSATAAAKKRIVNALLALVLYLGLFGLLQWLVPGGIFH